MSSTAGIRNPVTAASRFFATHSIELESGVLVAFSGGPDSSALLHVLCRLRDERPYRLYAAYVNHNLRDAAELDAEIDQARRICRAADVQLTVLHVAPGEILAAAAERGCGVEAAARRIRYALLEQERRTLDIGYIATGHQLDDQTETMLMRFCQGASLRGLRGIAPVRGVRIRPLLSLSRAELDMFLGDLGVQPAIDSSNKSPLFLRNRIRGSLIPVLTELFPGLQAALGQVREKAAMADDLVTTEAQKHIRWEPVAGGYVTDADGFFSSAAILRLASLYHVLTLMARRGLIERGSDERLPYRFLRPALRADIRTARGKSKSAVVLRGHGLELRIDDERLFWQTRVVHSAKRGYLLTVSEDGATALKVGSFRIAAEWENGDPISENTPQQGKGGFTIPGRAVYSPVVLRSRRPGDEISTSAGKKPVKKLLADLKIAAADRDIVPVVEDTKGIVAVLAAPFGGRSISRSDGPVNSEIRRFLRLTVSPSEE
ncbi:MAG TPA: tRNA lysidine(34) synthetase TilS [Spirochaetia bacterium]|nr:tRNA lysidine(34) synthetase TilS [Spirochaetia bacterium]